MGDFIGLVVIGNIFIEYWVRCFVLGISGKILNNELGYLWLLFNELYQLGEIDYLDLLVKVKVIKL